MIAQDAMLKMAADLLPLYKLTQSMADDTTVLATFLHYGMSIALEQPEWAKKMQEAYINDTGPDLPMDDFMVLYPISGT